MICIAAFEWSSDLVAPGVIAILGVLLAVFFSRRAAAQEAKDQSGLALESLRRQRELDAIDALQSAALKLSDVISNRASRLTDTSSAVGDVEAVREEHFRFNRTTRSLEMRLRPELRSKVVPFAKAGEQIGRLRSKARMWDFVRPPGDEDSPNRDRILADAKRGYEELESSVYKIVDALREAMDLYSPTPTESED